MHRFLIADDHPLFREALIHVLGKMFTDLACTEVCSVEEALAAVSDDDYALILLDLYLPGVEGFSGWFPFATGRPRRRLSSSPPSTARNRCVRRCGWGRRGSFPSPRPRRSWPAPSASFCPAALICRRRSYRTPNPIPGDQPDDDFCCLTRRQMMVLELLAEGKSNKEIARELDISQITAKAHISAILRKLRVSSRAQAIVAANRMKPSGMM